MQTLSVDEVANAIRKMSPRQRERLLSKISDIDSLLEDLEDIRDLRRTKDELTMPFDEFVEELRAEGHEIPHRASQRRRSAAFYDAT